MSLLPKSEVLCLVTPRRFLVVRRRIHTYRTLLQQELDRDLGPEAILACVGHALAALPDVSNLHVYLPSCWFVHWEVPWLAIAAREQEYLAVAENLVQDELGISATRLQFSLSPAHFEESRIACGIRRDWVDALKQLLQPDQELASISPLYALHAMSPSHAGALCTEDDCAVLYQRNESGLHVYCRRLPQGPGKLDALRHFIRRYAPALPSRWQNSDPSLSNVLADPLLGKSDDLTLPDLARRHPALQHNTLAQTDKSARPEKLPWVVLAATAAFLLIAMSETRELTRETVALKYQTANLNSSDTAPDTDHLPAETQALISQVGAQLRFPWDSVFNTIYQPIMGPQLISLSADNASSTVDLRMQSTSEAQFWSWFNLTRTNPALMSLDVIATSQGDTGVIHDVRSRWRRPSWQDS